MEAEAEIMLTYSSEEEASAVSSGVSPDNLICPEGLTVETLFEGKKVITLIKHRGENVATFMATIDDLLSCIITAEKSILAIKGRGDS